MKMVMLVYNEAMDEEVMEVLQQCVMQSFTKITGVYGKGISSGTHLGNDVWPGRNHVLYVACDERQATQMLGCCRELRRKLGSEGVKAFVWTLDELTA